MTLDLFQLPIRQEYAADEIGALWDLSDGLEGRGTAATDAARSAAGALHAGRPHSAVVTLGELLGSRLCHVCGMSQCYQLHPLSVRCQVPRLPGPSQFDLEDPAGQLVEMMTAVPVPLRYTVIPRLRYELVRRWLMAGTPELRAAIEIWSKLMLKARHGAIESGILTQKAG